MSMGLTGELSFVCLAFFVSLYLLLTGDGAMRLMLMIFFL